MTFDEFKALALNPPHYDGGTICRLDVYCYADEWGDMSDGVGQFFVSIHIATARNGSILNMNLNVSIGHSICL